MNIAPFRFEGVALISYPLSSVSLATLLFTPSRVWAYKKNTLLWVLCLLRLFCATSQFLVEKYHQYNYWWY